MTMQFYELPFKEPAFPPYSVKIEKCLKRSASAAFKSNLLVADGVALICTKTPYHYHANEPDGGRINFSDSSIFLSLTLSLFSCVIHALNTLNI
jgi:hypothetical protein